MSLSSASRLALTLGVTLLFAQELAGYTLGQRLITREVDVDGCSLPVAASVVPTTADRVYVWYLIDGVVSTDVFTVDWVQPSGSIHYRGTWSNRSGSWCLWSGRYPRGDALSPGVWTVRVSANGSPLSSMTFRMAPLSEACPTQTIGATSSTGAALTQSDCRVGDFMLDSDARFARQFRFNIATAGVFRVDLTSSDFDTYLYLLDQNGSTVEEDDDDGSGQNSKIVLHLDPGDYTLLVTSYCKDTGAFRLQTSWLDPQACGVSQLPLSGIVLDNLRSSDCPLTAFLPNGSSSLFARQYRLVVNQPGDITIDLTSGSFDTYLYLLTSRYGLLDYDDDGGASTNSRITRRLQPGVYYVVATSYYDGSTGPFSLRTSFSAGAETITLYLHGLNSDSSTWDKLNSDSYSGQCKKIRTDDDSTVISDSVPHAPCYLYTFKKRDVDGEGWDNGDGATFSELGQEVGNVVEWIRGRHGVKVLILVGHSRGGLAARAYLQSLDQRLPFRTGLVTIGTPHLGSPFGRVRAWLVAFGKKVSDEHCTFLPESKIRFAFAPSTGYLATAHDASKSPSLTATISKAIRDLNAQALTLNGRVDLLGELRSNLTKFGENVGNIPYDGRQAVLDASTLIGCIAKNDSEKQTILDYIQLNLPDAWLNEGDGIVPYESQQVRNVPGVGRRLLYIDLKTKTSHVDETSRTALIKSVVDAVTGELGEMAPLSLPTPPAPIAAPATAYAPPLSANVEAGQRLRAFGARLPSAWGPSVDQAVSALRHDDSIRLFELGVEAIKDSTLASEPGSTLGLHLLSLAGTEKAAAAAVASLTVERGWTSTTAEDVGAEFARLSRANSREALATILQSSPPDSPAAAAAAAALAASGAPSAVRDLLVWARLLDGPESAARAASFFRHIASTKAITEFRKSITAGLYKDERVFRALQAVLEELDIKPHVQEASR